MLLAVSKASLRVFSGSAPPNFALRSLFQTVSPRRAICSCKFPEVNSRVPPYQPVRFKSRNKVRRDSVKVFALTGELKRQIKEEEMMREYAKVVSRFQDDLYRKLCLKLTPEVLYSIPIPSERVQLGEVATITSLTSFPSPGGQPASQILIDLSGRPDLAAAAKAAISQFLSEDTEPPSSKRAKAKSCSDLIQDVNQAQFTVRLRTLITGDIRDELARKGRDMLNRTKKEMDRIYQKFSKSISAMKSLSEDDKHAADEYLKAVVKAQHAAAEQAWKAKEEELLNC